MPYETKSILIIKDMPAETIFHQGSVYLKSYDDGSFGLTLYDINVLSHIEEHFNEFNILLGHHLVSSEQRTHINYDSNKYRISIAKMVPRGFFLTKKGTTNPVELYIESSVDRNFAANIMSALTILEMR